MPISRALPTRRRREGLQPAGCLDGLSDQMARHSCRDCQACSGRVREYAHPGLQCSLRVCWLPVNCKLMNCAANPVPHQLHCAVQVEKRKARSAL